MNETKLVFLRFNPIVHYLLCLGTNLHVQSVGCLLLVVRPSVLLLRRIAVHQCCWQLQTCHYRNLCCSLFHRLFSFHYQFRPMLN